MMTAMGDVEMEGLVSSTPMKTRTEYEEEDDDDESSYFQCTKRRWMLEAVVAAAVTLMLVRGVRNRHTASGHATVIPDYTCPTTLSEVNYDDEVYEEDYLEDTHDPIFQNQTLFLESFRDHNFDGWTRSFRKFKENIYDFKKDHFVPYLKPGSAIYESASGLGLNLYMTLEILQEQANITDITVYGNEYLEENAERSKTILQTLIDNQETQGHPKNRVGKICHGDSTDLTHVPASSFDLVFTGFISPLWDPLELNGDFEDNYKKMKRACRQAIQDEDWQAQKLVEIMQERQEDWFANWVTQMIRIAEPGAPIAIEENAGELCSHTSDWGGVSSEFWARAVDKYGWDVDPDSITFARRGKRYHVFMLKNTQR